MPAIKKEFPKVPRTVKLDYLINAALTTYSEKSGRNIVDIVEEALKDYFNGKEQVEKDKIIIETLEDILEKIVASDKNNNIRYTNLSNELKAVKA